MFPIVLLSLLAVGHCQRELAIDRLLNKGNSTKTIRSSIEETNTTLLLEDRLSKKQKVYKLVYQIIVAFFLYIDFENKFEGMLANETFEMNKTLTNMEQGKKLCCITNFKTVLLKKYFLELGNAITKLIETLEKSNLAKSELEYVIVENTHGKKKFVLMLYF